MIQRRYIDARGADPHAALFAVRVLLEATTADGVGLVLAPVKDTFVSAFAGDLASSLTSGTPFFAAGKRLVGATLKTPPRAWLGGPVLAVYPSRHALAFVESLAGVTEIIALPWSPGEVQPWIDEHRAHACPVPPEFPYAVKGTTYRYRLEGEGPFRATFSDPVALADRRRAELAVMEGAVDPSQAAANWSADGRVVEVGTLQVHW